MSGKVLDPNDLPVAGAEVTLAVAGQFVAQSVTAGANPEFHFSKISPGSYFLDAVPPKALKAPKPTGGEVLGWVRTFYPNAPEKASATQIRVTAGGNFSGQNIRLRPVPLYGIKGLVFDDHGGSGSRQEDTGLRLAACLRARHR